MKAEPHSIFILICSIFVIAGCATNSIEFLVENDALVNGRPTDTNYTNGLELRATPIAQERFCSDDDTCTGIFKVAERLNFLAYRDSTHTERTVSWGIGQTIYTPNDISLDTVQSLDRPYAGLLFGRLRIDNDKVSGENPKDWKNDQRRTVDLQIGVVGPLSLAEQSQTFWHDEACDCTHPEGWDLQIDNEAGFTLSARIDDRIFAFGNLDQFAVDAIASASASLGNIYTGVEAGILLRFGWNLDRGFGTRTITDVAGGVTPRTSLRFFGFLGATGKLVARDIFLQGNTFKDSIHSVEPESYFGQNRSGIGIGYGKWSLLVQYIWRDRQYETQQAPHRFGSLAISRKI